MNAFAQGFEGTISMEIATAKTGDKTIPMSISTKGDKSLIKVDGPMGAMNMYTDRKLEKITMVMPAQKMGISMSTAAKTEKGSDDSKVTVTEKKKMINGYNCQLYTVTSEKSGTVTDMWLTGDLPKSMAFAFKNAFSNPGGRNSKSLSPAIEEIFKKGLLPIQFEVKKDGKTESTVNFLSYKEEKLDDSVFVIPSDIKVRDMPAMGGGGK